MAFDLDTALKQIEEMIEVQNRNHMRCVQLWRWIILLVNTFAAVLHAIPPYKTASLFFIPFHLALGIGVFAFMTKTYRRLVREHTVRKLSRNGRTRWTD
jgi:hypothetical protein